MNRRTFIEGAAALGLAGLVADEARAFGSSRLSVVVRGSGPDVILIPGLTSGRAVWEGLVRAVPGYRYHLVQVAGFAGDPARGNASGQVVAGVAAEIARYIADVRLVMPALIGHSMGGIVAMMVAARAPARVGRVMAIDILPAPAAAFGFDAGGLKPFADALFGSLSATPEGRRTLERMVGGYGGGAVARSRSDSNVVARATHELATTDLTPELPRIRVPFAVVYAVPSDAQAAAVTDRRYAAAYARSKARLRRVPRSGHMIMYDQPQLLAAEVRTFLRA